MIFYITLLRTLATCLITNSHYEGIYPSDIIANGGLIGDVIFFAVSGYCLYHVKGNFFAWYGKRICRCYLPVVVVTGLYMALGFYTLSENPFLWWYIYPTCYHFVASIVVLYIPFFVIMRIDFLKKKIPLIMALLGVVYLAVYIFVYDKSYYHIDQVREPFIRFLFMESMLLGAYFRRNDSKFRNGFSSWQPIAVFALFVLYFASKLIFARKESLSEFQIVNQLLIFALLYFILRMFAGMDATFAKIPKPIKNVVTFFAGITLEIYVVQYVLIDLIRSMEILVFPINWLVLTTAIVLVAWGLHFVCEMISYSVNFVSEKCRCCITKRGGRIS